MLTTLFLDEAIAQEKSAGVTFSYAGTGVEYAQYIDNRHFAQYQLRIETSNLFWRENGKAGISASAYWNTVFAKKESRNANIIHFYAGPGVGIGYGGDGIREPGLFLGLRCRVGASCSFPRGIAISLSVSPMLGGHFRTDDGMINMRLYRSGLFYGIMPEAAIRYIF